MAKSRKSRTSGASSQFTSREAWGLTSAHESWERLNPVERLVAYGVLFGRQKFVRGVCAVDVGVLVSDCGLEELGRVETWEAVRRVGEALRWRFRGRRVSVPRYLACTGKREVVRWKERGSCAKCGRGAHEYRGRVKPSIPAW